MVKPKKFGHLHLVYYFKILLGLGSQEVRKHKENLKIGQKQGPVPSLPEMKFCNSGQKLPRSRDQSFPKFFTPFQYSLISLLCSKVLCQKLQETLCCQDLLKGSGGKIFVKFQGFFGNSRISGKDFYNLEVNIDSWIARNLTYIS